MVSATPSIKGEWNACETSSDVTAIPRSVSFALAAFTAAVVPEMTV